MSVRHRRVAPARRYGTDYAKETTTTKVLGDKMSNLLERAVWTFVQAFASVFVVSDLSTSKGAAVAGAAAVLSVLKTVARDRLA